VRRGPDQPAAQTPVVDAAEQPGSRVPRLPDCGPVRVEADHPARFCQRDGQREASVTTNSFGKFHQKLFSAPEILIYCAENERK